MTVIIREKRRIAGREMEVRVYKRDDSSFTLSKQEREQAERLDRFLAEKMAEIENRLRKKSLLETKGKKGVLRLWHELGRELRFIEGSKLISEADKRWLWRALYDHAPNLSPGSPKVRANERPENSHFYYCYLLASKFPDFDFVKSAGDWTAWAEFLDSPSIRDDPRIIEWLARMQLKYAPSSRQDWLRKLTREIRRQFPYKGAKTDTRVFSDEDLNDHLQEIFQRVYGAAESPNNASATQEADKS